MAQGEIFKWNPRGTVFTKFYEYQIYIKKKIIINQKFYFLFSILL